MSDFLGRLVQRSVRGATQGLRPRLPSVYEPTAPALPQAGRADFFDPETTSESETVVDAAPSADGRRAPSPPRVARGVEDGRRGVAPDAGVDSADEAHSSRAEAGARDTVVSTRGTAWDATRLPQVEAPRGARPHGLDAESDAPLFPRGVEAGRHMPLVSEAAPLRVRAPGERLAPEEGVGHAPEESGGHAVRGDVVETARSARRYVVAASAARPPRKERRIEAAGDAGDGGPTVVRVHIGRVEVRAVTAPAKGRQEEAARKTAAPSLSLDDYLKQRGGGRG